MMGGGTCFSQDNFGEQHFFRLLKSTLRQLIMNGPLFLNIVLYEHGTIYSFCQFFLSHITCPFKNCFSLFTALTVTTPFISDVHCMIFIDGNLSHTHAHTHTHTHTHLRNSCVVMSPAWLIHSYTLQYSPYHREQSRFV